MRHSRASSDAYWSRVAVLLFTLCVTNESVTAVSFEEFVGYPFNESNGYTVFPRGLDLEQGLPIPVPFPYFGRTFSYAHIDDSGYISLLDVNSSGVNSILLATPHTPRDFPLDSSNTILSGIDWGAVIAPYWYDVDTRGNGSGRIYYKDVTRGTGADLIGEIDSLAAPHLCGFATTWALIITWDHVGFFLARSDFLNTFQVVIATDGLRSIAVFNYAENGIDEAGGGAVAGYNVGDDIGHLKLPGSLSEDIQYIDNTTGNTGRQGQWVFLLDEYLPPPSQLTVLQISPTSFTVSWKPPLVELGNGSTLYYLISVADTEDESMVLFQHMANETTLQLRVAELLPDHVHQVSVAAVFGEGIRSAVTLWIKTSLLAKPLTPPTHLTVLDISPTSFTISWRPPQGDLKNRSIIYYLVNVADTEGNSVVLFQHTVNDTTLQLRVAELLPEHVHRVSVAAVSGDEMGPVVTVFIKTNSVAVTNFNTTVAISTLGSLLGLLLLIVVAAVILGTCIKLCIHHKKQNFKITDTDTAADYDVVEMVSVQENPAYADVHATRKNNYYSANAPRV